MQFTRPRRVNQSVQLFRFIRQSMSKNHKRGTKMECRHGPTNTFTLGSPLGDLEVISCPFGLHSLKHMGESTADNFLPDTNVEVKIVKQLYEDNGYTYKPALQTVKWLQHYFTGGMLDDPLPAPALCLSSHTGPFFQKVWHTLEKEVGFGRVVNYGELAEMCANPHAQQAVGQAMKKNPFSIIVPCHRVILSSGKTGNYSGGKKNNMKEWLLRHEGAIEKAC